MMVGRIRIFSSYWTEDLSSSLAIGQKLPSFLCHVACLTWQLALKPMRESTNKTKVTIFCNLITEVISYCFALFYWLEASPQVQSAFTRRGLQKTWISVGRDHWGPILEVYLPQAGSVSGDPPSDMFESTYKSGKVMVAIQTWHFSYSLNFQNENWI